MNDGLPIANDKIVPKGTLSILLMSLLILSIIRNVRFSESYLESIVFIIEVSSKITSINGDDLLQGLSTKFEENRTFLKSTLKPKPTSALSSAISTISTITLNEGEEILKDDINEIDKVRIIIFEM